MASLQEKFLKLDKLSSLNDNKKTLGGTLNNISFEERLYNMHKKPPTPDQVTLAESLGIRAETIEKLNCSQMRCLLERTMQESFRTILAQKGIFVNTQIINDNGQLGKIVSINYFNRIIIVKYENDEGKIKSERLKVTDLEKIKVKKSK